jgi:hypothetical protein
MPKKIIRLQNYKVTKLQDDEVLGIDIINNIRRTLKSPSIDRLSWSKSIGGDFNHPSDITPMVNPKTL